jgi:intracellular multiplication protein IcmE
MAPKLKNIANIFKDTKSRTIFIILAIIILIALLITWFSIRRAERAGAPAKVGVQTVPAISSIPGMGTPTREYARAQEEENVRRAQEALRTGTAAVPTIIRGTYTGPSEFAPVTGPTGRPVPPECSPESLARAKAAGVKAEELRCKGCDAAALRAAGYTAGELMSAGFSPSDLRAAGFSAGDLRNAGFSAAELVRAGYTPAELVAGGYNAADLIQAGISPQQLTAAGITQQQLAAAGIGLPQRAMPKDCSVEAIAEAKGRGVTAAELRRMGCGVPALRAAGYTPQELREAGFSAKELKDAGFSANELKAAGYTAGELRQAGYTPGDLRAAGYTAANLREAGIPAEELADAGYSADELKAAGYSDGELVRAGLTPTLAAPTVPGAPGVITGPTAGPGVTPSAAAARPGITPTGVAAIPGAPGVPGAPIAPGLPGAVGAPGVPSAVIAGLPVSQADPSVIALEKLQQRQAEQLSQQERQDRMGQLQQLMATQAGDLFASWSPPPLQQFIRGEEEDVQPTAASSTQMVSGLALGQTVTMRGILGELATIKAGDIMFGVLDTSLNSDEPSPILASIVDGPLKGARLVGQFQRINKKVIVNFNTMNVAGYPTSIPINAVAIDPNTARTALASHVNTHFLMRYGTLFASSFVSGLARAVEESDSTTTLSLNGITTTNAAYSTGEKALIGLGEVGRQFGSVLGNLFTRPPTVTVNSGEGIGVLFMSDVSPSSTAVANPPSPQSPAVISAGTLPATGAAPSPPPVTTALMHTPQIGAPNTPVPGTPPAVVTTTPVIPSTLPVPVVGTPATVSGTQQFVVPRTPS